MKKTAQEKIVFLEDKIVRLIKQKENLIEIIQNIISELKCEGILSAEEWALQLDKDLDQALE